MDKKDAEQYEASLYLTFTTLKKQKKTNYIKFSWNAMLITQLYFGRAQRERTFLSALIKKFLSVLMSIPESGKCSNTDTAGFSTANSILVSRQLMM